MLGVFTVLCNVLCFVYLSYLMCSVTQQEIVDAIKTSKDNGPLLLHHVNAIDTVIKQQEEVCTHVQAMILFLIG